MIKKIVSGGQTGVDRAALDAAIKFNIPHSGWCPKGRLAEDGEIAAKYLLHETASSDYSERTKLNIKDSDGTLILVNETPIKVSDGTLLTIDEATNTNKPLLIINLSQPLDINSFMVWIKKNNIQTLNIAGPRESQSQGIYQTSFKFFEIVFPLLSHQDNYAASCFDTKESINTFK